MNSVTFDSKQVGDFYSPTTDGMIQLKGTLFEHIDQQTLISWYHHKKESFQKKEEKYIENNQQVSLVFNGSFSESEAVEESAKSLHKLFLLIRNELGKYSTIPFKQGDRLETKLMLYPPSELGVGAHRDLSSNINAVILMNIYGTVNFYTSSDKNRSDEKKYTVEPGDIMIMRGPRNKSENDFRPLHYVLDVPEERLVFVCREIEDATEQVINKDNWMGF